MKDSEEMMTVSQHFELTLSNTDVVMVRKQVTQLGTRLGEIGKEAGFNVRVLRPPNALLQAGFVVATLSRTIQLASKEGVRLYQPSLDREGYLKFAGDWLAAMPTLRSSKVIDDPKPELMVDPITGNTPDNPYDKETEDLSSQTSLEKNRPQLAAYLKRAASRITYRQLIEESELKRMQNEAAVYDGPNVFLEDDPGGEGEQESMTMTDKLVARAALRKLNPVLATQLAEEARNGGPIINPFSLPGSLTLQLEVEKRNPELAHLMKVAALHERAHLDRELEVARAAHAKAQFEATQASNRLARSR